MILQTSEFQVLLILLPLVFSGSESNDEVKTLTKVDVPDTPKLAPVATSLRTQPIYTHSLKALAIDSEGAFLATGNGAGRVQLWRVADAQWERSIQAHKTWAFSVSFSPDSRLMASGGGDNVVRIWDVATGEKKHELAGHTDDVHGVVFLGDSKRLASAGDDKTVRIWDLATGEVSVLTGHARQVTAIAVSPDRNLLATASRDATVRLWDAETGKFVGLFEGHEADVLDLAFSKEGAQLVTASYDKTARLWEVETRKHLRTFAGHDDWVLAVAVSPDGAKLATGSGDKKLRLWNLVGGDLEHTIEMGKDISALSYTPDGRILAVALTDGTVRLFDVRGNLPLQSSRLGPKRSSSKSTDSQTSATLTPQEYLTLHHLAMAPGNDRWKKAVAQLAQVGDGFTLQLLHGLDKSKLNSEDTTLLANTVKSVSNRVSSQDAAQVVTAIQTRLERAATADLQCGSLEARLVPWVRNSIRRDLDDPAVQQELKRIRDHYESDQELAFGSLIGRVRAYAAELLKAESVEATR
jgi:WD40 repeat protein